MNKIPLRIFSSGAMLSQQRPSRLENVMNQLIPPDSAMLARSPLIERFPRFSILAAALLLISLPSRAIDDAAALADVVQNWNGGRVSSNDWLEITFFNEAKEKKNLWCRSAECSPSVGLDSYNKSPSFHLYELKQTEGNAGFAKFNSVLSHYTATLIGIKYGSDEPAKALLHEAFKIQKDGTDIRLLGGYELDGVTLESGKTYETYWRIPNNIYTFTLPHPYSTMTVSPPSGYAAEHATPMANLRQMPKSVAPNPPLEWFLPIEDELNSAGADKTEEELKNLDGIFDHGASLTLWNKSDQAHARRRQYRRMVSLRLKAAVSPEEATAFNYFEARFLIIRVQMAGKENEFFEKMRKLDEAAIPGFVAAWRWYIKAELNEYLAASNDTELPDGPIQYQAMLSAMNQRTADFMAGKAPTFPSANGADITATQRKHLESMGAHLNRIHSGGVASVPDVPPSVTPGGTGGGTLDKKPAKKKSDIDDIFDKE